MPTAVTTASGHTARALRFYNESSIFIGYAKTTPWTDENSPPIADVNARNLGMIVNETYSGVSLSSSNCTARVNGNVYTGGSKVYVLKALTASTYEIRESVGNVLVGSASYAVQTGARTNIITGVDITVTGTLVANQTYTFTVDGPIGYKAISAKYMVVPDNILGTITHGTQKYRIVASNLAAQENARWVYIETTFSYDELPVEDFRQLGVFSGFTRNVGVTDEAVIPSQVLSVGVLELLDNRKTINRAIDQQEVVAYIIEH
jgi:hypothetical protein